MTIPTDFLTAISAEFYDKTISKYTISDTVSDEGWASISDTTLINGTFEGNIQFDHFERLQEQYGLKLSIDAVITTDENVDLYSIVGYASEKYKIVDKITNDSHYLYILEKWHPRSSTTISS